MGLHSPPSEMARGDLRRKERFLPWLFAIALVLIVVVSLLAFYRVFLHSSPEAPPSECAPPKLVCTNATLTRSCSPPPNPICVLGWGTNVTIPGATGALRTLNITVDLNASCPGSCASKLFNGNATYNQGRCPLHYFNVSAWSCTFTFPSGATGLVVQCFPSINTSLPISMVADVLLVDEGPG